jgi:hypothetical protein
MALNDYNVKKTLYPKTELVYFLCISTRGTQWELKAGGPWRSEISRV